MFERLRQLWNKHGFEIFIGLILFVILVFALIRIGKKGTWSTQFYYNRNKAKSKRKPPVESKGEAECRRVLQQLFSRPFAKARPDILNNPVTGGGNNLELDCYCSELKLAVEYNGVQHYKFVPFFHKNKEAFLNQKYRDELKRRMCLDNGITLIEVPHTVKVPEIRDFLIKKLQASGFL